MNSYNTKNIGNGGNSFGRETNFESDFSGPDHPCVEDMNGYNEYDNNGYSDYSSDGFGYDDNDYGPEYASGSDGDSDGCDHKGRKKAPTRKDLQRQTGWHGSQPVGCGMRQLENIRRRRNSLTEASTLQETMTDLTTLGLSRDSPWSTEGNSRSDSPSGKKTVKTVKKKKKSKKRLLKRLGKLAKKEKEEAIQARNAKLEKEKNPNDPLVGRVGQGPSKKKMASLGGMGTKRSGVALWKGPGASGGTKEQRERARNASVAMSNHAYKKKLKKQLLVRIAQGENLRPQGVVISAKLKKEDTDGFKEQAAVLGEHNPALFRALCGNAQPPVVVPTELVLEVVKEKSEAPSPVILQNSDVMIEIDDVSSGSSGSSEESGTEDEESSTEEVDEIIPLEQIMAEEKKKKKKDKFQTINITNMCDFTISSNSSSAHASARVSPSGFPVKDIQRREARMKANVLRLQRKFAREQNDKKQSLWNGDVKDQKKAAEAIRGQCACRHKLSKHGEWLSAHGGHCPNQKKGVQCGFSHNAKELRENRMRNICSYELIGCDEDGKTTLECPCAHIQIVDGKLENSVSVKKFLSGEHNRSRARPCGFVHHVPKSDGGLRLETEEEFESRLTYKIDQPMDWGSFVQTSHPRSKKGEEWGPGKFYARKKKGMTVGSSRTIITSAKTSTGQSYASRASRTGLKRIDLPVIVDVIDETCLNCKRAVYVQGLGVKQYRTCKCSGPLIQWGRGLKTAPSDQQKQNKTLTRFAGLQRTGGTYIVHGEVNEIVNKLISDHHTVLDDGRTVSVGKGKDQALKISSITGLDRVLTPLQAARACKGIFDTQTTGTVISYKRTHRWTMEWTKEIAKALGKINIDNPKTLWRRPIEDSNGNGFSTTIPHWVVKAILGQTKDAILTLQRAWRGHHFRRELVKHAKKLTQKAEEDARAKEIAEELAREKEYQKKAEMEIERMQVERIQVERMRDTFASAHPSLMVSPPATNENKRLNQARPAPILVPAPHQHEKLTLSSAFSGQQDRSPTRMNTTSIGFDWSAPSEIKPDDLETEVKNHFGKHGVHVWEFFQEIGLSDWNDLEEFEVEFFDDAEVDGVTDFWRRKKLLKKKVTNWVNANKPSVYGKKKEDA
jgi:hypothetical protein